MFPFHQGADGTNIDAGPAELAAGFQQGGAKGSADQGLARPLGETDGVIPANFLAGPDAAAAGDAQVIIPVVKGIGYFQGNLLVFIVQRRFQFHAQVADGVLELAAFIFGAGNAAVVDRHMTQADVGGAADVDPVAGQAAVGMFGNEHLHYRAAQFVHIPGFAADPHPFLHRQGAGGGIAAAALDSHDAHSAGGVGFHPRMVAEIGHIDAGVNGRFQNHFPRLGGYFHAVNGDGDLVGHSFLAAPVETASVEKGYAGRPSGG